MNWSKLFGFILLAYATLSYANTYDEIEHLLNYVSATSCKYERNGELHTGAEARKHIVRKYEYYRDKINSAEDFIKYAATKSAMSGKKYKVHCANTKTQYSSEWLLNELNNYRKHEESNEYQFNSSRPLKRRLFEACLPR
jgi:hypothetical protein